MEQGLNKVYDPSVVEERLYKQWEENGYFKAEPDDKKEPFTIVIPPPNVTGQLHMGHALDETLQDILIRYKRMAGYSALWVPGTDHAGIATQIKVEEYLRENEGLTRYDLGREKFLERVWDWKKMYGDRIIKQLKTLGCSCDWSRERFTMDEGCSKAVREVFVNLYEKGLIYKGNRIINWCPKCTTALSDAEVSYEEEQGHFWHIKYMLEDSDDYVIIATTRPETLLGDTAVAVHPDDERYKNIVGKNVILPLVNKPIPVVADEYVEMDFGTGVVKITPAHDPNDFEVGKRHNLEQIKVMNDDATINKFGGKYAGMDRYEARKQIVADLDELGLLVKIEEHTHNVGHCYRCNTTVEPLTSDQWFVKMKPLAEKAIEVVKDKTVQFVPDRFSKIYLNWMENVLDWCISRQLWWGHRIPAFYCEDCGEMVVSKEDVTVCPKCGGKMTQENDVLDTWFSSALWPFSTLGWPEKTKDLEYFYPTSVLVTGYDIIFFWVARMIFSGMEHMEKEPFKYVFLHGIVRDSQGRKMSKSLGNGIDPLEVIKEYGADALRFTLATGNSPGNDMRYYDERVKASRNFANKLWNAARFVLMNIKHTDTALPAELELATEDKWILSKLDKLAKDVTENIDKFELGIAVQKLYDFIWDEYCDWYIELCKPRLQGQAAENAGRVLSYVLSRTLELLHPFMPFITEEIWQNLPHDGETIMRANWFKGDKFEFPEDEENLEMIKNAIKAIRNARAEKNVPPSKKAKVYITTDKTDVFTAGAVFFEKLASASEVVVSAQETEIKDAVAVVSEGAKIEIPLGDLVNKEEEAARLNKEKERLIGEIKRLDGKLGNPGFVAKAPEAVVNAEKAKKQMYQDMLDKVLEALSAL
ncbi:MAG: valine--tRNA ligase [Clostridia bacterium]|nr:valine--tRNA ligase [Clostridia bacterium]